MDAGMKPEWEAMNDAREEVIRAEQDADRCRRRLKDAYARLRFAEEASKRVRQSGDEIVTSKRDSSVCVMRCMGATYAAIGRKFGFSKTRARDVHRKAQWKKRATEERTQFAVTEWFSRSQARYIVRSGMLEDVANGAQEL